MFGRVLGRLAVSRAFGDFDCKNIEIKEENDKSEGKRVNFILNQPDIYEWDIDPVDDEFILIASDGLFDKFSSQEAVNFVRERLMAMEPTEQDP